MVYNDPLPKSEKSLEKHNDSFWTRFKRLLLGNWFFGLREDSNKSLLFNENRSLNDFQKSVKQWFENIDMLATLIRNLRQEVDISKNKDFTIEILGVNTYLFHLERLSVKLREYVYAFKYRIDQHGSNLAFMNRMEVMQFCAGMEHAQQTIMHIKGIVQTYPVKKLYNEDLINSIHALELEVSSIGSAIRNLNQAAYQQEIFHHQLGDIESSLLQSLDITAHRPGSVQLSEAPATPIQVEKLQVNAIKINQEAEKVFVNKLIESYDLLKKCYVVSRKQVVNQTLVIYSQNINQLIELILNSPFDKDKFEDSLANLFYCLESIRFSSNHPSRCSKILHEKAKMARLLLRSACKTYPHGLDYIRKRSVKRDSLLKKA